MLLSIPLIQCPFGFLADPKNKKLVCPDCRAMACAKCLVPWEPQHEGRNFKSTYRVFIKYCVFFEYFNIFRTLAFFLDPWCTHTRQVEHQRCRRTDRVQTNHKILGKEHNILWTPCISFIDCCSNSYPQIVYLQIAPIHSVLLLYSFYRKIWRRKWKTEWLILSLSLISSLKRKNKGLEKTK